MKTIGDRPQNPAHPYPVFSKGDKVAIHYLTEIEPGTVVATEKGGTQVHVRTDASRWDGKGWIIEEDPDGVVDRFTLRKRSKTDHYVWTLFNGGSNPKITSWQRLSHGWKREHDEKLTPILADLKRQEVHL